MGEDDAAHTPNETAPSPTCFRLVVVSSSVLPRKRRVAVLDGYSEVQVGRDASASELIPRIRLKDMEVSKLHATLFWDAERDSWAIVDMGSKHGTFVRRGIVYTNGKPATLTEPIRLSASKQASLPRAVAHLDEISIGSTVFAVHVHTEALPCPACASEGESDIPLFSSRSQPKPIPDAAPDGGSVRADAIAAQSLDAKKSLSFLKRTLLARHSEGSFAGASAMRHQSAKYVDRSAMRRSLHPYSRPDPPHPPSHPITPAQTGRNPYHYSAAAGSVVHRSSDSPTLNSSGSPTPPPASGGARTTPSTPISSTNIGHRLLAQQGWTPGTSLGIDGPDADDDGDERERRKALIEPLQVSANRGRLGLGMVVADPIEANSGAAGRVGRNWKEDAMRRRWGTL